MCGLQSLWHVGLAAVVPGHHSTGSIVVAHRLSCFEACGIFTDQGWKFESPRLASKFFTTGIQGKSPGIAFLISFSLRPILSSSFFINYFIEG